MTASADQKCFILIRRAWMGLLFLAVLQFGLAGCGRGTARLSWEDNSDNEEGFRVYKTTAENREKIKIAEVEPDKTTYVVQNASSHDCYFVTAFNSAGESPPTKTVCVKN